MKKYWYLIVLVFVVFTFITVISSAHGIADQINDPATLVSMDCGTGFGPGPGEGIYLYQGFVPTVDTLVAVDLHLRIAGTLPAEGVTTSIKIRDGAPTGPVIGESSALVMPDTSGTQVMVHFDFDPALSLVAGDLYVIEWFALVTEPGVWDLSWMATQDVNSYPAASTWSCLFIEMTATDFNFITYGEASAPVARDDSVSTAFNTPVNINVVANDSDVDADLILSSVTVVSGPGNGSAMPNGDGTVTYTPNAGFSGTDSFTYQICDATALCDTANVSVTVASGSTGGGPPSDAGPPADAGSPAGEHANSHACEDNPGRANDHRPSDIPPCR
jgi:hypothetical protein